MTAGITYYRRTPEKVVKSSTPGDIFLNWKPKECWLFLSAHDDDIVTGGGLTFLAAIQEGVEVHAVVTTDGRMGYCRPQQRRTISQIRFQEAQASFQALGLPLSNLHFLKFPDCNLAPYRGRHFTAVGDPTELEGATGLQNSYTYMLRKIRPTRVFLPTLTDLHPDHRIAHEEMLISLFHAQGSIWPELGEPTADVPAVYEYATYCDFATPPQIRIQVPEELLTRKLDGIRAYASQEQIDLLIEVQRKAGPAEYIREVEFNVLHPGQYDKMFL